ncbi:hypothetical protein [Streptomyces chartreusis]|uniref:hypothetical protein n=1 Tax=Streptomyces chartreusis TaxID=1969 RepID=UPI0033D4818F
MPTPPPFMRTCPQCAELLAGLVDAFLQGLTAPLHAEHDGAVRVQILLARHLADVHPDDVPAPHSDGCPACARFERLDSEGVFWREHLARGLFLPDEIARLM